MTAPRQPPGPLARVLRVVGNREARRVLERLGMTERAVEVLRRSTLHRIVHVGTIEAETARLLRREMTRLGGEAALPELAWKADGSADVLLAGTLRHFDDLLRALAVGDPETRGVGEAIERALRRDGRPPRHLRLRDQVLPLDRTLVMGILNVTPDSFSDGGLYTDPAAAVEHAESMQKQGADLIDVGAVSSRPGAGEVPLAIELERLMPVLEALSGRVTIALSVDTARAEVARRAVESGAALVNDTSALSADPDMAAVVAETGAGCVLMHSRGTPQTMHAMVDYRDLLSEVYRYLAERVAAATEAGIDDDRIVIDPGIGFAKTGEQNLTLLQRLGEFRSLGLPVMVGTSRKAFIGAVLDRPVGERVHGTMATVAWAVFQGARIVRVHDVAAAVEVARMADAIVAAQS